MLFGASFVSVQKATLGSGSLIGLPPRSSEAWGFGVSNFAFRQWQPPFLRRGRCFLELGSCRFRLPAARGKKWLQAARGKKQEARSQEAITSSKGQEVRKQEEEAAEEEEAWRLQFGFGASLLPAARGKKLLQVARGKKQEARSQEATRRRKRRRSSKAAIWIWR